MPSAHEQMRDIVYEACSPLTNYVCPLYMQERDHGRLVGTGVPVRLGRLSLVVTAAHVMMDFEGQNIYTMGGDAILNLGGERRLFSYQAGGDVDVDLAVVILNAVESENLERRFTFTSKHDLATIDSIEMAVHFLVGYPFTKNKPTPRSRYVTTATAACFASRIVRPVLNSPLTGKHSLVHFALQAAADGTKSMNSESVTPPKPHGISGGGVWRLRFDVDEQRMVMPKLVGVGIEYDRTNRLFLCSQIAHILPMIDDVLEAEVVDELRERFHFGPEGAQIFTSKCENPHN